jgi:CubicO group peptidase (beta-lactamase class C family)
MKQNTRRLARVAVGLGTVIGAAIGVLSSVGVAQAQTASGCQSVYLDPQKRFPRNEAPAAAAVEPLPTGQALGPVSYKPRGSTTAIPLEDYFGKFCTTGFLVMHEGQIVYERYLQHAQPTTSLLSASMSKTVLSLLIGIAIGEGRLSLDDRVAAVLPDFRDSAFADDTLEDLLRMSSGVALKNSFRPGETSDNQATNPMIEPLTDVRAYLAAKKDKDPAGKVFNYNGAVTAVLGLMLSERTGMSNTDYLARRLWAPMGAQAPAYWVKNRAGQEGVQGQFVASLRDYARLGLLIMNGGRVGERQVVPQAWIEQMTTLRRDKPQPAKVPYYGLHIWIPQVAGGRSFAWGTNGQNIFVDPIAKVVIVHTGNSPDAEFNGNDHLFPLRDAITAALLPRSR